MNLLGMMANERKYRTSLGECFWLALGGRGVSFEKLPSILYLPNVTKPPSHR